MLGKIYLENNINSKTIAKKTNIIWWQKKNGTNCGIFVIKKESHNNNFK